MIRTAPRALAATLVAASLLGACKKNEEAPPPVVTPPVTAPDTTALPPPTPLPTPAADAATAVSDLQLGTAVGADNRVGTPATSFGTRDTLYASVTTAPNTTGKLGAHWTYLGADGNAAPVDVDSQTKDVSGAAAATHEFHVSKPDGWPAGRYHVDVTLDGKVVQSRDFDIR